MTLAPQFTQVPACGYNIIENIVWTIPSGTPITEAGADRYVLNIESTDGLNHHQTVPVNLKNTVTYSSDVWEPQISFSIEITDPCRTSTITPLTLTAMSVVLGAEEFQTFTEVADSAGTSYGGASVCGTRLYEILDFTTGLTTSVATIIDETLGNYKIRAHSTDENNEGGHNLIVRITFVNYPLTTDGTFPKAETNLYLFISQASCNCRLITWDNPAPLLLTTGLMTSPPDTLSFVKATANEDSKSASPAIRACYRNNGSC